MSANVDLVRSIYADWERGDFGSADWAAPDIAWTYADGPSARTWVGHQGLIDGSREWLSAWEDFRNHPERYIELDDGRVAVLVGYGGRGKSSGVDVARIGGGLHLWEVSEGKVVRLTFYFERDRALAELGLGG